MTPWVRRLLIANIAMFVVTMLYPPLYRALVFVPALVLVRPWTLVTYMFLHAGLWHILFNMVGLYFFGPRLEARLGTRDFIVMYLLAGLTGAILSFFLTPGAAIVGASGAVFGVLLGFARYWPDEPIYIWGILPIPARVLVIIVTVLSLYSGFSGAGGRVAHFAHLGGFAGAWIYLRIRDRRASAFRRRANRHAETSPLDRISGKAARDEKKWEAIRVDQLHEINRHEVERIRAKLEAEGAAGLTAEERAFMNRMSE